MSMTSSARTMGPDANATPSARTTRPSASVLLTSIVRPLRVEGPHEASSGWTRGGRRETPGKVLKDRRSPRQRGRMGTSVKNTHLSGTTTSSGRNAAGPTAFSATQRTKCSSRRCAGRRTHTASNAASIAAAPPMSDFIPGIPLFPLICNPPVSNVMPFPTSATTRRASLSPPLGGGGVYLTCTSAGSRPSLAAASPTATSPPNPPRFNASYRRTSDEIVAPVPPSLASVARSLATTASASRTIASGSIAAGGASTSRPANRTPRAAAAAAAAAASDVGVTSDATVASFPTTTLATRTRPLSAIFPRPSAVSLPATLFAVYSGKHRATAVAIGIASASRRSAVTIPSARAGSAGADTPARIVLTANGAALHLVPLPPSSPFVSTRTISDRFPPPSPAGVSRTASVHTAAIGGGSASTSAGDVSDARAPRTTTLSHASASSSEASNAIGEDASQSSFVMGVVDDDARVGRDRRLTTRFFRPPGCALAAPTTGRRGVDGAVARADDGIALRRGARAETRRAAFGDVFSAAGAGEAARATDARAASRLLRRPRPRSEIEPPQPPARRRVT
eukprot:30604-Pelagococcus_subviridis.AAC.4